MQALAMWSRTVLTFLARTSARHGARTAQGLTQCMVCFDVHTGPQCMPRVSDLDQALQYPRMVYRYGARWYTAKLPITVYTVAEYRGRTYVERADMAPFGTH